ncbi:MAG: helix-turn-helix transcriptional regulator [Oscillospiraceae bacterium]|nr:helix-turn-helix transcriptional regulator [Oscillospiraceae bacterium]
MEHDAFLVNMGSRIARRRKELHLTQEQLAEKIGVSLQTVSCIELGKKAPRPEDLAKLCLHLNISSDYILYGKRSELQLSSTITKLSRLPPDAYQIIESLVDLLDVHN